MPKILILGGTTEASTLAARLHAQGVPAVLSYAGRVERPRPQPVPVRVGGFGGADGLATYLRTEGITHVMDATHPFAAQISTNAIAACQIAHVPLMALERAPWPVMAGDVSVPDMAGAVDWLADQPPARVFLAIGRQALDQFGHLNHHFLLRVVDPPQDPPAFADAQVVVDRGPFDRAGDMALMRDHGIDIVVAKNAGGVGAEAKILAARELGLRIVMIARPAIPVRVVCGSVDAATGWLHDHLGV